jgi:hypothetical protein
MPTNICVLDDLHLLPHFVPSRLDQHIAQSSVIVARQKEVEIEVEEVAVRQLMRTRAGELEGIQNVYVI